MSSSSIAIDTPYRIVAPEGGLLQLSTGSVSTTLVLAADAKLDEQQWVFWPSAGTSAWKIENYKYDSFFVNANSTTGILSSAKEADTRDWYVRAATSPYYHICGDSDCATVWAPASFASGGGSSRNVAIIPSTGADFELWGIVLTSSPVPTSPIFTSMTATSPVTTTTSFSLIPTFSTTTQSDTSTRPYPPTSTDPAADKAKNLQVLQECDPCGKSKCEFTPSGEPSRESYSVLIGQAVSNCNSNSQSDTVTKIGGSLELESSWTIQATSGAGLGNFGPSISFTTGHGEGKKVSATQETEVTIKKGQIGGLVANVSYTAQAGILKVKKDMVPFMSIDPEYILGISVVYTSCDQPFHALEIPRKIECKGKSDSRETVIHVPRLVLITVGWMYLLRLSWF